MSETTTANASGILTYEEEEKLLAPIDAHVSEIQRKVDALRAQGTYKIQTLRNHIKLISEDKHLTKEERTAQINADKAELAEAKKIEAQNRPEVQKLVGEAEAYLEQNYNQQYYKPVEESVKAEQVQAKLDYEQRLVELKQEHEKSLADIRHNNSGDLNQEIKDEKYVYKNKVFDAKVRYKQKLEELKTRKHEAYSHKYHLIDLLRLSRFSFAQNQKQRWENYKYTFNTKQFLLNKGLFIVIAIIFVILAIITPILKDTSLFTQQNILNILQQASPRMYLALGVAGLILLTGTDLSIGRMVGMGMVAATVIMHAGPNTGTVFGVAYDFSAWGLITKSIFALIVCIILCVIFTSIAGFFTARFKMHPFISTMANMLIIFGIVTYATKGVSFGAIDQAIPQTFIPTLAGIPTIIIWALIAIVVVWFIWNKTKFGKNLYAVGGNPDAAAVSGISVFG
ncbi:galactoside ABC transporter permease [Arcanobacterium hippocoleae]